MAYLSNNHPMVRKPCMLQGCRLSIWLQALHNRTQHFSLSA
uniref:Uncharacterized protein n=1 Tax=Anguilla anguilla TaxID=7936 RepID=A0A0E9XHV5_ANGAN